MTKVTWRWRYLSYYAENESPWFWIGHDETYRTVWGCKLCNKELVDATEITQLRHVRWQQQAHAATSEHKYNAMLEELAK